MRRYTFLALLLVLVIVAVACQTILPETPVFRRIVTPTEPGRGPSGEIGILVDPTPTPTLPPGFWLYRTQGYTGPGDCREMIMSASPTAEPEWTRVTTGSISNIPNNMLLCNTNQGLLDIRIHAIGKEKGHTHGVYWDIGCDFEATGGCTESVNYAWTPVKTSLGTCGIAGHPFEYQNQSQDITLGSWVSPAERDNALGAFMLSGSLSGFGCAAESYHGYRIEILSTATPESYPSGGYIVEINASQDITPTTSAHMDYNLHAGQGADDEFVEIWCPTPTSMAGWEITDATRTYTFAQDNFCEPLKLQWCDEMLNCDAAGTGFPASGTWYLYDASGNLMDTRTYPTMATPGNSWAAYPYTNPGRPWREMKPHPGTYPTATPSATSTATPPP